jgi:fatty acid desaturase
MEPKRLRLIEFTGRFRVPRKPPNKQVTVTRELPNREVTAPRRVVPSSSEGRPRILSSRIILLAGAVLLACIAKGFVQGHPWIALWLGMGAAACVGRALTMAR